MTYKRKIWNYERADFAKYRQLLSEHDLSTRVMQNDIDKSVQIINDAIFDAAEKSIPNKVVTIRPNDYPWITCYIKTLMRRRRRLYNKLKKTNSLHFWNQFKILRNKTTDLIRKSKQDYFDKLENILTHGNFNSKQFWKTSKQLLKLGKSSQSIPTLYHNNKYAETELQKANMLNDYFSSQAVVNDDNNTLPPPKPILHDRLEILEITPESVKDVLDGLDVDKACGPDLMSPRLLKEGSSVLAQPYSIVYTSSLRLGHFPTPWKDGNVTAIYKRDDRSVPKNYRPITLLCQPGKSMERCVHKELGQTSEWTYVKAGVPQGSILGPLLFLIYINDIVHELRASVRLFADDTTLYIIVENPNTAGAILNGDLNCIDIWGADWLVDFNAAKTLSMILSLKRNPPPHPPLYMNGKLIANTISHKHLGLTFNTTCSWTEHISNITSAAWTRLNLLRSLKFKVNRLALEKMYISFVRPLLEYCDAVWDNASTESKKQLEAVHNEAARIITGATKLCSISNLFSDLGWESLQARRTKHKLIIFYKIINGLTPEYLQSLIPPMVQNTTSYNLRNSSDLRNIQARTNIFYNSFLPSTIRAWNELPEETKTVPSVASFKYRLNRDLLKPPKYFNCGSRIGQIMHARLRMECSSLNAHLYRKNIVPSPSCSCGGFESVYHFFFECPNYADIRTRYLPNNLKDLNTNQLLCGIPNATVTDNETLFCQVQEFIIRSRRFT